MQFKLNLNMVEGIKNVSVKFISTCFSTERKTFTLIALDRENRQYNIDFTTDACLCLNKNVENFLMKTGAINKTIVKID
jgi:hypothetical protein